jgi:hypothetical protein
MSAQDAEILRRARTRIEDPSRWTAGAPARANDGSRVFPQSPNAVCWCVIGAVSAEDVWKGKAYTWIHEASKALGNIAAGRYNDQGHEFALRLIDKAIELAEAS